MKTRAAWIVTLFAAAACTSPGLPVHTAKPDQPTDFGTMPSGGTASSDGTVQLGMDVDIELERPSMRVGGTVRFRLVNTGKVTLGMGYAFSIERRRSGRWVEVPHPPLTVFPQILVEVPPGGSFETQEWPFEGMEVPPGRYRIVKSAIDPVDADLRVTAHAEFQVLPRDG